MISTYFGSALSLYKPSKSRKELLTVSKNLIPYSSASACPLAVDTAWGNEIGLSELHLEE